jgi:hypothetical protein
MQPRLLPCGQKGARASRPHLQKSQGGQDARAPLHEDIHLQIICAEWYRSIYIPFFRLAFFAVLMNTF